MTKGHVRLVAQPHPHATLVDEVYSFLVATGGDRFGSSVDAEQVVEHLCYTRQKDPRVAATYTLEHLVRRWLADRAREIR